MDCNPRTPVVVFAQVPPPEHGQSRMVLLALDALRRHPGAIEINHINARFSHSLEDIGENTLGKLLLTTKYLAQAIGIRLRIRRPILYYVPGPVKWSSVLRDWVLLAVLRLLYARVVFHWHAIGQGEWAHGSQRLALGGPRWVDRLARRISAYVLHRPFASISVSETSRKDARAVSSQRDLVVCNGIEDPCPDFETRLAPLRLAQQHALATAAIPSFKILFLSHGTEEKGTLDALACMHEVLAHSAEARHFQVTFAGGISEAIRGGFDAAVASLQARWPGRICITEKGYLTGDDKRHCFVEHDIFLAPSRWESFGLTVIEAMAYGMPVVAAASDGVTGVLPRGYAYLSPVGNPPLLASNLLACCSALRDRPWLQDGRALRARVLANFLNQLFVENFTTAVLDFGQDVTMRAAGVRRGGSPASGTRESPISVQVYLADQNPGYDRSFGISRMSHMVVDTLQAGGRVRINAITSKTSQRAPGSVDAVRVLPWGTRGKWVRLLTDHLHPLFIGRAFVPDVHYFPKGYLPLLDWFCAPSVVTIHDTIIQYDEDHYPRWRRPWEYGYWAMMLKHTLRKADRILTVSESSKQQIHAFMDRHRIPRKEIIVTYEPCLYESTPQPVAPAKGNYVIHLASCEPHKRTAHLIRWWHAEEARNRELPELHLIGTVPPEVLGLVASSRGIVRRAFLEDAALQAAYLGARALILPSEIEGFGLPALEAYYLGTPVCFVKGTSVEEVLGEATGKGGFSLASAESLFSAVAEVMGMDTTEVYQCGLSLRASYAAERVAARMIAAFAEVRRAQ